MPGLIKDIASAHGLTADAEYAAEYPVTVNDAAEAEFALKTAAETFGEDRSRRAQFPITGAEDFSFVLEEVPGAFVFLGACPPDRDPETAPTNHSAIARLRRLRAGRRHRPLRRTGPAPPRPGVKSAPEFD